MESRFGRIVVISAILAGLWKVGFLKFPKSTLFDTSATQSSPSTEKLAEIHSESSPKALLNSRLEAQPDKMIVQFPRLNPALSPFRFEFALNANEQAMSLSELLFFIKYTWKNSRDYELDYYDCKNFAYQLHLDAQKLNISSRFVAMKIQGSPVGHAFNSFKSSDQGILYVDFTPKKTSDGKSLAQKNVVYAAPGEPYMRIPIDYLPAHFSNKKQDFYKRRQLEQELKDRIAQQQESILIFNGKVARHNAEQAQLASQPFSDERSKMQDAFNRRAEDFKAELADLEKVLERLKRDLKSAEDEQWDLPNDEWIASQIDYYPKPF